MCAAFILWIKYQLNCTRCQFVCSFPEEQTWALGTMWHWSGLFEICTLGYYYFILNVLRKNVKQVLTLQLFCAHFWLRKADEKNIMRSTLNMLNCKCVNRKMNNPDIWMPFVYFAKKKSDFAWHSPVLILWRTFDIVII